MKTKMNEDKAVDIIVYILLALTGIVTLYLFFIRFCVPSMMDWI